MKSIVILENEILEYAWGSKFFISRLTGKNTPFTNPQAEMWMGAHKKAPSIVNVKNKKIPLNELIREYPDAILGRSTTYRFSKELPFLFKVLAASKPLSIQAHPDKHQAEKGFSQENINKIPNDAPERNYRDKNHKPELLCALTNMWILKGFRHPDEIIDLFRPFDNTLNKTGANFIKNLIPDGDIKGFFKDLLYIDEEIKNTLLDDMYHILERIIETNPVYKWVNRLRQEYPNDIGILSPLFLNLIHLEPGEAIFLPSREFHAYLDGAGLEIMANSDNVLRGGLTPKHIDKTELLNILDFAPVKVEKIKPKKINSFEQVYESPAEEFILSVIELIDNKSVYKSSESRSVEITLCTDGCAEISNVAGDRITLNKGMCALIPASADCYTINGKSTIFKATVPEC